MSISKLIPLIADNLNKARNAYFDYFSGQWVNGFTHAECRSFTKEFLDYVPHKLAAEKQLNLSLFGKFSVLDEASPETQKGIHISFRPAPKLVRLVEQTPKAKTTSIRKEISEKLGWTQESTVENVDAIQHEICAALVKKGDFTIQQLGTFLITNDETPATKLSSTVRFRPKPYLQDLLSTLTDKQVNKMITDREKKRASRKKPTVSSGALDRKRLARVRKLLHSRDPDNVAMAILVLEQVALPEDYVAVFETSGLIERLLRSDSVAVVDSAAKIAVATKNESVFDRFCEMIGLKSTQVIQNSQSTSYLDISGKHWISSSAVEEFFGDTRNKTLERISLGQLSNLTYLRLVGLSQLSEVNLGYDRRYETLYGSSLAITSLHLEKLPALEEVNINAGDLVELSFSGLQNLKQLELSCSISELPKEIGDCCALKKLGLAGTALRTLPDVIGQLSQLEDLDLRGPSLTELPDSIGQLSQLKILNLNGTGLTSLPYSIGQLSQLESLDLSGSSLTDLPESIGQLSQLQSLDLSGSGLTHLPESIGGLTSLTSLDLSSTCLVNIPKAIGQLSSLQHLLLPTTLERIPHEIGRLTALETFRFCSLDHREDDAVANMRIILDLCRQLEGAVKG